MLTMPEQLAALIIQGRDITERDGREMILLSEQTPTGELRTELWPKNITVAERAGINHPEVRNVEGYDNRFLVTEDARIISKFSDKILKTRVSDKGYEVVATKLGGREGVAVMMRVHRVVATAYIENPDNKPTVNHADGIKTNNHRSNLEWATHQENTVHAFDTGLAKGRSGCDAQHAKLTENQVLELRSMRGEITARRAGEIYGMAASGITNMWNGKTYAHVK